MSSAARRRAFFAVCVYALVAIITAGWALLSMYDVSSQMADIEAKTATLEALKRRPIKELLGAKHEIAASSTIAAASETLAANAMQRLMTDRLQRSGGALQTIQVEPGKESPEDGLQRLNAQLSFESEMNGLQALLLSLETGSPYVFVDSLTVQPNTTAPPGGRIGDRLRVNLIASSYWKQQGQNGQRR